MSSYVSRSTTARGGSLREKQNKGSFLTWMGDCTQGARETIRDKSQNVDMPLLWIIMLLLVTGIILMYSASFAYAYYNRGSSNYFVKNQLIFAVIGLVGMFVVSLVPAGKLKRIMLPVFLVSIILLGIALILPAQRGVRRWIPLGFTSFQPSEITKFAVILFGATWADSHSEKMHTFKWGVVPFLGVIAICSALLIPEPHLSCTVLVLLLCATMMFVGGTKMVYFVVMMITAVAGIIAVIFSGQIGYSSTRIKVWLDPFYDPIDKGWQNIQSLYAISSGGLLGQGLGNSRQKYLYISEPQNDFVFSVVCEELGFIGATLIIILFLAFIWRGFIVSVNNTNRFCKLLGIGITSQVGWQAFLNMAVVTKMIPNTGISLPFFSAGGSSLVMLLLEMGVLLSISRHSTVKKI